MTNNAARILDEQDVKLGDILADSAAGSRLASYVYNLAVDLGGIESQLRSSLAWVQRNTADALDRLDNGALINGLGILQGSALDVDRGAALYDRACTELSNAVAVYKHARIAGLLV